MEPIKHRIAHYWSHRASSFEEQREREFNSYMKEIWLTEIHRYLPKEKPLIIATKGFLDSHNFTDFTDLIL